MRFRVWVNHGSTFELRTTLTVFALGANAAADAGSSCGGILSSESCESGGGVRVAFATGVILGSETSIMDIERRDPGGNTATKKRSEMKWKDNKKENE